jgi:hypothetical protein
LVEVTDAFINQTKEWRSAEGEIPARRQQLKRSSLPGSNELRAAVRHEVAFQYAIWSSDFLGALEAARAALTVLTHQELRGYRALWLYLAGAAAMSACTSGRADLDATAREYFRQAKDAAPAVGWLSRLLAATEAGYQPGEESLLTSIIERLEVVLTDLGMVNDAKYAKEEAAVLSGIMENDGKKFEQGHERLGKLLGYEAGNRETAGAPDPWWIANESLCFIFEDYTEATKDGSVAVKKARQAATHANWVRANLPVTKNADIVSTLVTEARNADRDAVPHLKDVSIWQLTSFREWATTAVATIRELRRDFPGAGDLVWRSRVAERYKLRGMDPSGLRSQLVASNAAKVLSAK